MFNKRIRTGVIILALSLLLTISAAAQGPTTCPVIVSEALEATDASCADTGRNEACYGNIQITAIPKADAEDFTFEQQGDRVSVSNVESLLLSELNEDTGAWGVALLRVQANIPDTLPGQNVTFLLFGDVEISNSGDAMEAFVFRSGIGDAPCEEAPDSGILISTPEGAGEIELTANGVDITLGSTAYLQAEASESMDIAVLEGQGTVSAEGQSRIVEAGMQVSVPLDEDLMAAGPPGEPEPIAERLTQTLPLHTVRQDDDDDGGDGGGGSAGGGIVPISGNWVFTMGTITSSGQCPPGMTDAMSGFQIVNDAQFVEFGDGFDLQSVVEAQGDEPFPGTVVYDNPETNVYTMNMSFSDQGATMNIDYTFRVESETSISGDFTFSMEIPGFGTCTFGGPYTWEMAE